MPNPSGRRRHRSASSGSGGRPSRSRRGSPCRRSGRAFPRASREAVDVRGRPGHPDRLAAAEHVDAAADACMPLVAVAGDEDTPRLDGEGRRSRHAPGDDRHELATGGARRRGRALRRRRGRTPTRRRRRLPPTGSSASDAPSAVVTLATGRPVRARLKADAVCDDSGGEWADRHEADGGAARRARGGAPARSSSRGRQGADPPDRGRTEGRPRRRHATRRPRRRSRLDRRSEEARSVAGHRLRELPAEAVRPRADRSRRDRFKHPGVEFDSEAQVLQTPAMVRLDWQRTVLSPQVLPCLRSNLKKHLSASERLGPLRSDRLPRDRAVHACLPHDDRRQVHRGNDPRLRRPRAARPRQHRAHADDHGAAARGARGARSRAEARAHSRLARDVDDLARQPASGRSLRAERGDQLADVVVSQGRMPHRSGRVDAVVVAPPGPRPGHVAVGRRDRRAPGAPGVRSGPFARRDRARSYSASG